MVVLHASMVHGLPSSHDNAMFLQPVELLHESVVQMFPSSQFTGELVQFPVNGSQATRVQFVEP